MSIDYNKMKIDLHSIRKKFNISVDTIRRLTLLEEKIVDRQITEQLIAEISELYAVR